MTATTAPQPGQNLNPSQVLWGVLGFVVLFIALIIGVSNLRSGDPGAAIHRVAAPLKALTPVTQSTLGNTLAVRDKDLTERFRTAGEVNATARQQISTRVESLSNRVGVQGRTLAKQGQAIEAHTATLADHEMRIQNVPSYGQMNRALGILRTDTAAAFAVADKAHQALDAGRRTKHDAALAKFNQAYKALAAEWDRRLKAKESCGILWMNSCRTYSDASLELKKGVDREVAQASWVRHQLQLKGISHPGMYQEVTPVPFPTAAPLAVTSRNK